MLIVILQFCEREDVGRGRHGKILWDVKLAGFDDVFGHPGFFCLDQGAVVGFAEVRGVLGRAIANGEEGVEDARDGEPLGVVLEFVWWGGGRRCVCGGVVRVDFEKLEEFPAWEAFV